MDKKSSFAIGFVCMILGFLLTLQFKSVAMNTKTTESERMRMDTLQQLLNDEKSKNELLNESLALSKTEIERFESEAENTGGVNAVLAEKLRSAETLAGLTELEGPGVTVTMFDSASEGGGAEASYIIHDGDILSVVNELRDAGAEALSLNGERLIATSEIRCTGATVSVNNNRYSVPFQIQAIGDPDTLEGALRLRGGVLDVLSQWGIKAEVKKSDNILIGAYAGGTQFRFAQSLR